MTDYDQERNEEEAYLGQTLASIRAALAEATSLATDRKRRLVEARREMWEEAVHFSNDLADMAEITQHLTELTGQTYGYASAQGLAARHERLLDSPYFGRFDWLEEAFGLREKIYLGRSTVADPETHHILVYDWRAPIASIFYRFELGPASYQAPSGTVAGEVLLKRQYKITGSKLEYFFDCSVNISDELLQEALARHTSPKMRSIVETIQREQDLAIRDTESQLLIVQGVAGSGKTSIALHRIAFLLYQGLEARLGPKNICIVSPGDVFSSYISTVLPELGEENVEHATFDGLARRLLGKRFHVETRDQQLEWLITARSREDGQARQRAIALKGSRAFVTLLDRLLRHWERRVVAFEDVHFAGKTVRTRQQLKNAFLGDRLGLPMARRLARMERILLEALRPLEKERLARLKQLVAQRDEHEFEVHAVARLLARKASKRATDRLHAMMQVDYTRLYSALLSDEQLFARVARDLELPADAWDLLCTTKERFERGEVAFEDAAPLLYLKLRVEGPDLFGEIRQAVIDEAQDYLPLHYEVFRHLFREARFTVLGDVEQAVEKNVDISLYDQVAEIMGKGKTTKLFLEKSYRSSYEITAFAQRLLKGRPPALPFERHEDEPTVRKCGSPEELDRTVAGEIARLRQQGLESVAVVCKTRQQAEQAHGRLTKHTPVALVASSGGEIGQGPLVIPAYVAKGLEFDAVIVYDASAANYRTDQDRKLLYVACTRALHRLALVCAGEPSPLLPPVSVQGGD